MKTTKQKSNYDACVLETVKALPTIGEKKAKEILKQFSSMFTYLILAENA